MRQKFVFVTAIAVCLSLALVPAFASGRTVDRSGDRTKASKGQSATGVVTPEFSEQTRQLVTKTRLSSANSTASKAAALVALAAKQDGDTAIATLNEVLRMEFQSSAQSDRIRSTAYELMAGHNAQSPARQVMLLGMALQYASDAARRASLTGQITALGGDAFSTAFTSGGTNSYVSRDYGADDTCEGAVPITSPHSEVMSIDFPIGNFPNYDAVDHNWRSFDVPGPIGETWRIETISDLPGTGTDDTELFLYEGSCGLLTEVGYNDNAPGTFASLLETECLLPGTYYVEVGGFFEFNAPDNFTLEIEQTGTCYLPVVDGFEPDDDRGDELAQIGYPTSNSGNGWGRAKKEIQTRSLFARQDVDHVKFGLNRNELVRIETAAQFGTFFNGFDASDPLTDPDTVLELLWENEPDYGGRCNQPDLGFFPTCYTDADCPDPLDNPIPGFPPCIPVQFFGSPIGFENPLVTNDDKGGGSRGSALNICLPRTQSGSPSLTLQQNGGDWLLRIQGFDRDVFDYEVNVKNEVGCLFENEPNAAFAAANPYEIGEVVHGIYDFVVTNPYIDADLYSFDVDTVSELVFETFPPDGADGFGYGGIYQSDTALRIYVGPDDEGDYFQLAEDDDGGPGWLSKIEIELPPANELLGNEEEDADYIAFVSSFYLNPNFGYRLHSEDITGSAAILESEPNNTIESANTISIGSTVIAEIDNACDVDIFKFDLGTATYITLGATAGGDSAISLVDCGSTQQLSCDDDSGGSMLPEVTGCLPAGSYCAKVRAFSESDTFAYEIQLDGTGGCIPNDPPQMTGDNAFTCLNFASCP